MAGRKIKVLIVDDSAVIRHILTEILGRSGDIEVVGTAHDPLFAARKIKDLAPDVITLDVEMPRMDGLTFLRELMAADPHPVVMISASTETGCETTLTSLELGAVDYVLKPNGGSPKGLAELSDEIIRKIRIAAAAKIRIRRTAHSIKGTKGLQKSVKHSKGTAAEKVIAVGASTGGTQAITELLSALSESAPGLVIAQHMPPLFTASFARRLNSLSRLDVREARTGDRIESGCALIAPGDRHLKVQRRGDGYYAELTEDAPVNFVRPSVDVLFRSVAHAAGRNAVGILLTGMGEDGARGLLEMKAAGAVTIAQDEATSVVFGMPKKAVELGAADLIVSLERMPELIESS